MPNHNPQFVYRHILILVNLALDTTRDRETRAAAQALSDELGKLGFSPALEEAVELRPRIVPIKQTRTL
jgi:hypothetical protein